MTPDAFRRLALSLPEAAEGGHQGHPDFRVRGRVFATLAYPGPEWAMVKLLPDQQEMLTAAEPATFVPVKGGWGRRGSTNVRLEAADEGAVGHALRIAWRNVAPKTLAAD